jgi:hypothetical protein
MTYASGSPILDFDYDNFLTDLNFVWGVGADSWGYGQTERPYVNVGDTITATQWSTLVNLITTLSSVQATPILSMGATPTSGSLIEALNNIQYNIAQVYDRHLYAAANGTQYTAWTGQASRTSGSGGGFSQTIFNATVSFPTATQARYFFNAGGRIKIEFSKTSTGQLGDPDWNNLANNVASDLYITAGDPAGYIIAGQNYVGFNRFGGSGSPAVMVPNAGWYQLTPGAAFTKVYQQNSPFFPYTSNYIEVFLSKNAAQTQLNIQARWINAEGDAFSGGTAAIGATPGTAPCTLVTYFPPSTALMSASWGTPLISCTVS